MLQHKTAGKIYMWTVMIYDTYENILKCFLQCQSHASAHIMSYSDTNVVKKVFVKKCKAPTGAFF